MFVSRLLLCLGFVAFSTSLFSQGVFSAVKAGAWTDPTVWNLDSGSDADGIPDADDDVECFDYDVTVSTDVAANNLTLTASTKRVLFFIYSGSLTISNNLTLTNSNITNNFSIVRLYSGNIIIAGDVIYNNPSNSNLGGFQFYNFAPYNGLQKNVYLGGSLTQSFSLRFNYRLTDYNIKDVNLIFNGGTDQWLNGDRTVPNRSLMKIQIENASTLKINANVLPPTILDSILINSGSIYLDKISLAEVKEFENQITVASGSKITVVDNVAFPDHLDKNGIGFVTNMQAGSTSEFVIGNGISRNVLTKNFNYQNVAFVGTGTKTITNNIGVGGASVDNLTLNAGTLIIDPAVTDLSGITGTITVKNGAILRVLGSPTMPLGSQFVFEQGSTIEYAGNVPQTILGNADFWNINFDGTGIKTTGNDFSFKGEMSFESTISTLNINHNVTIKSNMVNTGFISEIPTGYNFVYGGGQFICERFFISSPIDNNFPAENYRDFSLPLKNAQALLSQFDDDNPATYTYAGGKFNNLVELPIFGVAGSKYPGPGTNVSDFNSFTGAFGKPSNYNNSIVQTNGSGRITTNAVRFGYGTEDGLTIMAKGEVNIGDVPFNAQKSTFGKEFNLFGNPYPCAVDFEAVVAGNPNFNTSGAGIIPTFYVIAPDLVGKNNTAFYNAVTNAGTITSIIPAYQGFFLEVSGVNNTNYNFTISESMKTGVNLATYKSLEPEVSPEIFSIIAIENGVKTDQIHSYFYEGATVNFDEYFDVKKLEPKVGTLSGAQIDFYDGKKKMNLLANAISSEVEINLPFVIDNPSGKTITLELENLNHLLDVFNCVYVENLRTGETFPIDGNYLSIAMGTLSTETFALKSKSAPELFEISKTDATCFGLEDGILRVDMSKLPENSPITVFKNNTAFDSFTSTADVYKRNVGAGDYEFKISGISQLCSYVYRENVKEAPEVKSDFILADSLFVGRDLVFKSTATNATLNEWFTSKGETLYGDSIVMNYETAGKHWLKLTAIGKYSHCKDEELKFFIVDSAQTSVGVKELETSAFYSEVIISTQTEQLTIANLPNNTKVELINTIGQILEISDENKGIVTFAPLNNSSYIIRLTNNGEVQSYHIGL